MESRISTVGPWKLLRFVIRVVLQGSLTWLFLLFLYFFLPFPTCEHEGDNGTDYVTAVLRSGKTLTRVYDAYAVRIAEYPQQEGFILDYKLELKNLTLDMGWHMPLPLTPKHTSVEGDGSSTKRLEIHTRSGGHGGADMPWFKLADSVLLDHWIHSENEEFHENFPVLVQWTSDMNGASTMKVHVAVRPKYWEDGDRDPYANSGAVVDKYKGFVDAGHLLLSIEMQGQDTSTITATVPELPLSSSPSLTYLLRLAIFSIVAPTAIFVNENIGPFVSLIFSPFAFVFKILLFAGYWTFVVLGGICLIIVSSYFLLRLWSRFRGRTFEETLDILDKRLPKSNDNEASRLSTVDAVKGRLDSLYQSERFKAALEICRHGWHPERDGARAVEAAADLESGLEPGVEPHRTDRLPKH